VPFRDFQEFVGQLVLGPVEFLKHQADFHDAPPEAAPSMVS
jgi:hypothetical protein